MSAPDIHISLTPFDHCVPRAYYNGALYLPLKSSATAAQAFDVLHEGLHRAFVRLPWLNGKVHVQSPETPGWRPGQLELRYTPLGCDGPRPPQFKFKELDTDLDYAALQELGFPLDCFPDAEIEPTGFFADPSTCPDVFVGQANFLAGGCIVVCAIHHAASDETAFFCFLRLWADYCAAIQTSCAPTVDFPVGSDSRDILRQIWARETPVSSVQDIDPETWRLVGLLPTDIQRRDVIIDPVSNLAPPPPTSQPSGGALKAGVFYISPARLTVLREAIVKEIGLASGVSANDAVCALIWRCIMRARVAVRNSHSQGSSCPATAGEEEEPVSGLNMVCDGRTNYSLALPQTYLGNITFNIQSSMSLDTLTSPESTLGVVAATLHRNAGRIDSANLLNLYNLLDDLPSYDELIRLKRMRTSTIDGNNMSISSLINLSMDSVCFGDGPIFGNKGFMESARLLMEANNSFTRTCIVLPRTKTGGVEFLTNLYDEEMEILMADPEFSQYVMCLCWPE